MSDENCRYCGGPLEPGFVSTTNGSGLYWSKEARTSRLRPNGLQVLVPTEFTGMYSANLPGERCSKCRTIRVRLP